MGGQVVGGMLILPRGGTGDDVGQLDVGGIGGFQAQRLSGRSGTGRRRRVRVAGGLGKTAAKLRCQDVGNDIRQLSTRSTPCAHGQPVRGGGQGEHTTGAGRALNLLRDDGHPLDARLQSHDSGVSAEARGCVRGPRPAGTDGQRDDETDEGDRGQDEATPYGFMGVMPDEAGTDAVSAGQARREQPGGEQCDARSRPSGHGH